MVRRRRPPRPGALTELPPLKILTQIIILQTIYYVCGTAMILFAALVAGRDFSADLVLHWKSLRGDTTVGWMLGLCWMGDSFVGVLALLLLISRSKLVPDFAITLHFIHLLVVSLYSHSIPANALWWALQICSTAFMTVLGVWSCRWRELRPINFGGVASAASGDTNGSGNGDPSTSLAGGGRALGDEEQGFIRGGRRGRDRGGAGEYEMVGLTKEGIKK